MTNWKDSWTFPRFQRKAKRANLQVFFIMSLCVVSSDFNLDQCKIKSIILSSGLGVLLLLPFQFLFSISVCLRGVYTYPLPNCRNLSFRTSHLEALTCFVLCCCFIQSKTKKLLSAVRSHASVGASPLSPPPVDVLYWAVILHTLEWYSLYGRIWLVVFDRKKSVWWCWAYSNYWLENHCPFEAYNDTSLSEGVLKPPENRLWNTENLKIKHSNRPVPGHIPLEFPEQCRWRWEFCSTLWQKLMTLKMPMEIPPKKKIKKK